MEYSVKVNIVGDNQAPATHVERAIARTFERAILNQLPIPGALSEFKFRENKSRFYVQAVKYDFAADDCLKIHYSIVRLAETPKIQ